MATFTSELLESVTTSPPEQAWADMAEHLWQTFSAPIKPAVADAEVVKRDRSITELENVLPGSCWDLQNSGISSTAAKQS